MLTNSQKKELIRVYRVQIEEFETKDPKLDSVKVSAYCLWTDGFGDVVEKESIYEASHCFVNAKKHVENWAQREIQKHNDEWVKQFTQVKDVHYYTYTPLKYTDTREYERRQEYLKRKEEQEKGNDSA